MNNKDIALVVPCYKAHSTLTKLLSSVRIQSFRDRMKTYLVNDDPSGENYAEIIKAFSDLDIVEVCTEANGGAGVARTKGLQEATEEFITFMDADDVFYTPYAVEVLYYGIINAEANTQNIECQGTFLQECSVKQKDGLHKMLMPQQNPLHPWVFGRLYNTKFLKDNDIDFTSLRAMEDGCFNYQIRLLTEGTPLKIKTIGDMVYVWSEGSEHSITRKGADLNNGIPLYNYGNCQLGAVLAVKHACERVFRKNAFNTNIPKFVSETFVGIYFTYFEALEKSPMYAPQIEWLAKWAYHNLYIKYAPNIPQSALEQMFMQISSIKFKEMKQFPSKTFSQWFDYVSTANFDPKQIDKIHEDLPEAVKKAEEETGVFREKLSDVFKQ